MIHPSNVTFYRSNVTFEKRSVTSISRCRTLKYPHLDAVPIQSCADFYPNAVAVYPTAVNNTGAHMDLLTSMRAGEASERNEIFDAARSYYHKNGLRVLALL